MKNTVGLAMQHDNWNQQATNLLKSELARSGVNYEELIRQLQKIGVEESYKGIANKINRGAFSFVFFMQCMTALNQKIVRLGE